MPSIHLLLLYLHIIAYLQLMITSLHNQLYAIKTTLYIVASVLFMPLSGMAQLIVKDNTTFFLKGNLSTKTASNQFYSEVQGQWGAVYFVGKSQTVETAIHSSLPTLVVKNGNELSILSKLLIKGDLQVTEGMLVLHHEVIIHGKIKLQNRASIKNRYLITVINDSQQYNKSTEAITYNNNAIPAILSDTAHEPVVYNVTTQENKSNYSFNFYQPHTIVPVKPPPVV